MYFTIFWLIYQQVGACCCLFGIFGEFKKIAVYGHKWMIIIGDL